jgi:hypothetical protein
MTDSKLSMRAVRPLVNHLAEIGDHNELKQIVKCFTIDKILDINNYHKNKS